MPGKNKKPTCDLCCDSLDKGQEILKCEGDCGCTVHRYCAGVTRRHFEQLDKGSIPFVCQWCTLKTTHTIIQQLQSEVATLKLELAEAKTLAARPSATPPQIHSYASAASRPLDPVGNAANSKSRVRGTRKRTSRGTQQRTSARIPSAPTQADPANPGNATANTDRRAISRVQIEGARRVWNTYIHATTKTVENAISRFCLVEGLNIKRKTRTNNRTGKLNFI